MGVMRDYIGDAAMYEQLAEESAELAKAALKKARILRGENPTPITTEEADANVQEEFSDVITCAEELDLKEDRDVMKMKKLRFIERTRRQS